MGNSDSALLFLENAGILVQKIFYARKPSDSLVEFAEKNQIQLKTISELNPGLRDVVILYECPKIFTEREISQGRWINIHAGILPYWRGYNANSWALLSDCSEIGISIHEVTADLDAGPILKVYTVENDYISSYFELRHKLLQDVTSNFGNLLDTYLSGVLKPQPQAVNLSEIIYCARLKAKDGIVETLNRPSRELLNLFRVFSRKTESDFYLKVSGDLLKVLNVEIVQKVQFAPPGTLLLRIENRCLIKTLDGAVWLTFESKDLGKLKEVFG